MEYENSRRTFPSQVARRDLRQPVSYIVTLQVNRKIQYSIRFQFEKISSPEEVAG